MLRRLDLLYVEQLRDLPGRPDFYLQRFHTAVFVHGCFWHGHSSVCFRWPRTRVAFWKKKISENMARDRRARQWYLQHQLRQVVVWECALRGPLRLSEAYLVKVFCDWLYSGSMFIEISPAVEDAGGGFTEEMDP